MGAACSGAEPLAHSIVILGPGQQGLGCVLASSLTGANPIGGRRLGARRQAFGSGQGAGRHPYRLLGSRPACGTGQEYLGAELADVVVDVTGSTAAQAIAVDLVRRGGTVVLGGRTPKKKIPFVMDKLASRGIKMVGVRAHESEDVKTGEYRLF